MKARRKKITYPEIPDCIFPGVFLPEAALVSVLDRQVTALAGTAMIMDAIHHDDGTVELNVTFYLRK